MQVHNLLLLATVLTFNSEAKIMRNNALMTKMMSNFQKDNSLSAAPKHENREEREGVQKSDKVLTLMQNVLCRNFPSIPCDIITKDTTLNRLIERSIQQIHYKKMSIDRTTQPPSLALFPTINSEELSNFLKIRDSGYFKKQKKKHKKVKLHTEIEKKPLEYTKKIKRKETRQTAVYNGRKKLRKFYPHKVKYKDKSRTEKEIGIRSEEKLSMSVEDPEVPFAGKHQHFSYKVDPENSVWRIDYSKHGEPSLNFVSYDGNRGKPGASKIVSEIAAGGANSRKEVLRPDLYIKKNFIKKNVLDLHSDSID